MEEQKYYTPAPEDIRVGFEFEFYSNIEQEWCKRTIETDLSADMPFSINIFNKMLDRLRVPYLTAEQIEAEGWKMSIGDDNFVHLWKGEINSPGSISLSYWQKSKRKLLNIRKDGELLYDGTCRCINDLRLISKLLGI